MSPKQNGPIDPSSDTRAIRRLHGTNDCASAAHNHRLGPNSGDGCGPSNRIRRATSAVAEQPRRFQSNGQNAGLQRIETTETVCLGQV